MKNELAEFRKRYSETSLTANGHQWRWVDTGGDGPPVLFLPGSAGESSMFAPTLASFRERFRLVSLTPPALTEPNDLAHGLGAIVSHLDLPPCTVVGTSFGAYWGQFFALHHPARVRHLLIGNGFVDGTDLAANPLFDRTRIEAASAVEMHAQWRARIEAAPPSELRELQLFMIERKTPESLRAHFLAVVLAPPCPALSLPESAVTVLGCDDDPVIPAAARQRLRSHYPNARHVTFAHGGHYPHVLNRSAYEELLLGILSQ
jgi:maspardin